MSLELKFSDGQGGLAYSLGPWEDLQRKSDMTEAELTEWS